MRKKNKRREKREKEKENIFVCQEFQESTAFEEMKETTKEERKMKNLPLLKHDDSALNLSNQRFH